MADSRVSSVWQVIGMVDSRIKSVRQESGLHERDGGLWDVIRVAGIGEGGLQCQIRVAGDKEWWTPKSHPHGKRQGW